MSASRWTLPLGLALALSPAFLVAAGASTVPVYHLQAVDSDGDLIAEYLLADDHGSDPPETLGLLETREGLRASLSYSLDTSEGVMVQRFQDLQSGWWIELDHDYGMRNLGRASDHPDPFSWLAVINDRIAREKPTSTFTIQTSDGDQVQWVVPWGAPEEEVRRAETAALAAFATSLAETQLPDSAVLELRFLLRLLEGDHGDRLFHARSLLDTVERVLAVTTPDRSIEAAPDELTVDEHFAGRRSERSSQMLKMVEQARSPQRAAAPGVVEPD